MSGSRPKFFKELPADVNEMIIRKLGFREQNAVKLTSTAGRDSVNIFRNTAHPVELLAGAPRRIIQLYLQQEFHEKGAAYKSLSEAAAEETPHPYDYALYALIADVTTLDKAKLRASIEALEKDDRLLSIVTSLNIIDCYLAQQDDAERMQSLRYLLERAGGAYINLRGCRVEGDFTRLDFSFANLSHSTLLFDASGSNFRGANCASFQIGGATRLQDINFKDINIENASVGDRMVEWDADMEVPGAIEVRDVPLIQLIFATQLRRDMDNQPSIFSGCNIF